MGKLFEFNKKNIDENEKIESVPEYLKTIENLIKKFRNQRIYFRGLSDSNYTLNPSIARLKDIKYLGLDIEIDGMKVEERIKEEKNLFNRFRKFSYEHKNRILNKWEALFLAQHYEVPTRLMDWRNMSMKMRHACE